MEQDLQYLSIHRNREPNPFSKQALLLGIFYKSAGKTNLSKILKTSKITI